MLFTEVERLPESAALSGPSHRGTVVWQFRNLLLLFLNKNQIENVQIGVHSASVNRPVLPLSSSPGSRTRMPLTQQQAHLAVDQDTLLHGKGVLPSVDWDWNHYPCIFRSEHQQLLLWPHVFHGKHEA